jgi:DNA polymerase III gamma/tau subunit
MGKRTYDHRLINRYRPEDFVEFIGNELAVKRLAKVVARQNPPQVYLLVGPTGTGKTSLAEIIGRKLGCHIEDFNCAVYKTIADLKPLVRRLDYGGHIFKRLMYVLDETQAVKESFFEALLHTTEFTFSWSYICLCTTDDRNIPETLKNRVYEVRLQSVESVLMRAWLKIICAAEEARAKLVAGQATNEWLISKEMLDMYVRAADGSPRTAARISAFQRISNEEHLRLDRARRILDRQPPSGSCVTRGFAVELYLVMRHQGSDFLHVPLQRFKCLFACIGG